ncbi:pro-resilin-like [Cherax quadricarinatus]|uniref:pro-resilin-like n=1 Tax=Cherax quadricarinatus TaxID=27406 RepID=UPI00387E293D
MTTKVLVLAVLVAAALALPDPPPTYGPPPPAYKPPAHPRPAYGAPTYPDTPPQYNSQYAVRDDYSGNDFGHDESRNGYDTKGSYYVQLPDGRLQKVTYYVNGDSGYVAEVSFQPTSLILPMYKTI